MPITKIVKESQLYFEIKAKYESKAGTIQELATEYGLNRQYLTEYAKKEKWERGKQKEYYNAKKVVALKETLAKAKEDESEYKIITNISKDAEKKGKEIAQIQLDQEAEMEKARLNGVQIVNALAIEMLNLIQNGNASGGTVEDFEYDNKGKLIKKKTISKDSKTKILSELKVIDFLKSLNVLQTNPTVAIQNNNSNQINNQSNETPSIFREALEEIINQDKAIAPKVPKQVEAVESGMESI